MIAALEDEVGGGGGDERRRRRRRPRSAWVHVINQQRLRLGTFYTLVQEQRLDRERFQAAFRLTVDQFDEVLRRVGPRIARQDTNYRRSIPPAERLAICIR